MSLPPTRTSPVYRGYAEVDTYRTHTKVGALGRCVAACGLIALLVGIPALCFHILGTPGQWHLPTAEQTTAYFQSSKTPTDFVIHFLTVVLLIIWVMSVCSTIRECFASHDEFTIPKLPTASLVRIVLFGAVAASQFSTPTASAATLPKPPAVVQQYKTEVIRETKWRDHVVTPGESLWRISKQEFGDGAKWQQLWNNNHQDVERDGRTFSNPNLIQPGWNLHVEEIVTEREIQVPIGAVHETPTPKPQRQRHVAKRQANGGFGLEITAIGAAVGAFWLSASRLRKPRRQLHRMPRASADRHVINAESTVRGVTIEEDALNTEVVVDVRKPEILPTPIRNEKKIRVQLFGPVTVFVNGQQITKGLRSKANEMLAFLIINEKGATMEQIIAALWPEIDSKRGRQQFWTTISNLRSALNNAAAGNDSVFVVREGARFRIDRTLFDVDADFLSESISDHKTLNEVLETIDLLMPLNNMYSDWAIEATTELKSRTSDWLARALTLDTLNETAISLIESIRTVLRA